MKTRTMLNMLAKRFPKKYAKAYHDHVGLMTGKLPLEVNKILLCLDLDEELFETVKKVHPDIVISHHPFIFGTRAKVFKYDPLKKDLCERIDALGIPVYSFHTNFDAGRGGMNDALTSALSLENVYTPLKDISMRIGTLPNPMNIDEFVRYALHTFNIDYGQLISNGNKNISKVGIIGGGGSRSWNIAMEEGCDIYISGDAPHHVRRDIVNAKFNYLDVPHEVEKIFMPTMKKILLEMDSSLEIIEIDHEKLPTLVQINA